MYAHWYEDRRAGDAPVNGWGHDPRAVVRFVNSRQGPSLILSRIPGPSLRCAGLSVRRGPLPRAISFEATARNRCLPLYVVRQCSERTCKSRSEQRPSHSFRASTCGVADESNQPREAEHEVPDFRAFGAPDDH